MAIDVTLSPIVTGYNISKINSNFEVIEEALQDAVSRSGETPNSMDADLDMNGHDLLNSGLLSVERLIVGGDEFVIGDVSAIGPPGESATITVGTVTTGAAGTNVIITNVGDELDAIFDFTIPRGDTGASGAGSGDMVSTQNLNDVANKPTAFNTIKQAATDSYTGVVELATDAETITGTDTTRALTPANLQALTATDARDGIVELATNAETLTATDTVRAVTPASLKYAIDNGLVGADDLTSGTLPNARLSSAVQNLIAPVQDSVGTYVLALRISSVNMAFGDTTSGSNLRATNSDDFPVSGPSLTGTWRLMGDIGGASGDQNVSVFARIA